MDNNKKKASSSSSSSSTTNFDHLFGPKDPSTMSSSSTSIFGYIFPLPSSTVGGRDSRKQEVGFKNYGAPGNYGKSESSCGNKNETVEPSSYYSSSIYYSGQENYSPRTTTSSTRTTESHHAVVVPKITLALLENLVLGRQLLLKVLPNVLQMGMFLKP
ncbi:uncharacterized protein [Arachis hypogaea]|uniref:uncharacterized protein n=1 Tax=Arachis hypogaea TaxID=3818 RepID=UPI0007AF84E4|nr:uncharacterized protein LOC112778595 [Arachis hypogaea]